MDKANGVTIGTPEDLSLNGSLGSFFAGRDVEAETHVETDGCTEGGDEVFVVHQPGKEPVCLSGIGEVLAKLLPELISYGKE